MIIAMEEYIEQNGITEIAEFARAIRYEYPEWHTILATKMTLYFSTLIRSQRHILRENQEQKIKIVKVNELGK